MLDLNDEEAREVIPRPLLVEIVVLLLRYAVVPNHALLCRVLSAAAAQSQATKPPAEMASEEGRQGCG